MAVKPRITLDFTFKNCDSCGRALDSLSFLKTKSFLFPSGYINICTDCLAKELEGNNYSWNAMDRLCQYLDIPFMPDKYEELKATTGGGAPLLEAYNRIFFSEEYEGIDWGSYEEAYRELDEQGALAEAVPALAEQERTKLQQKWGMNYDDEALRYLENLYDGMTLTQNINGALQIDQALKICKVSYEIDCCLREGKDIDKLLASYDKLVKTGEFTPKNVKNASDFESMGELVRWLEKKGFVNQFYDGETRDVVDETIKNIQSWNQRLYTNESGIGDEITQRIQSLKTAAELETYYDLDQDVDYDDYENEGFNQLMKDDEFAADLEGEGL
jgi:hypothetical protein